MKASQMRDLEDHELHGRVAELRKELFGLRFSNATGELDDTAALGRTRRDLARALTVMRERDRASAPAGAAVETERADG